MFVAAENGPIETVITLDSDHVTIIDMTVTVQTEQLGSVVAMIFRSIIERNFTKH